MANKFKVTITLEDMPDGSTRVLAEPNMLTLIDKTKQGPMAKSMAVAFAMSVLTHIASENRKLVQKGGVGLPKIILPPGIRS